MKTNCILGAILLYAGNLMGAIETRTVTVHFDSDGHVLDQNAEQKIFDFVREIELAGDYEFQIYGHTDHEGNQDYNDALSNRRANSVRDALIDLGMDPTLCVLESHGEKRLLHQARDEQSMAENRRVKIVFKRYTFESLEELKAELSAPSSHKFQIDPSETQVLECSNGSKLHLPANSFKKADGTEYDDLVEIDVVEAHSFTDFFAHSLTTWSDDKILQTGGMIQITAQTLSGEKLTLTDSSGVQIALPIDGNFDNGMELFISDAGGNWTTTGQTPVRPESLSNLDRPQYNTVNYRLPSYNPDESGKPRRPGEPHYPLEPKKPRPESYFKPIKWYQYFSKDKLNRQYQARYDKAMFKYEQKMEHHWEAVRKYEVRCEQYPDQLDQYYTDMETWRAEIVENKKRFEEEELPEARNQLALMQAGRYEEYSDAMAVWREKQDEERKKYYAMLEEMGIPPGQSANFYLFEDAGMGWYNCDKFWEIPEEEKAELVVQLSNPNKAEVLLIHPEEKSMLTFYKVRNGRYKIDGIPKRVDGDVLAYQIQDGNVYFARGIYNGQKELNLKYKPIKLRELKALMAEYNG